MNKLIIALFLCLSFTANADPAPFGLEIGKATVNDVKKKYKSEYTGNNKYSHGDMYSLDINEIGIDGLQSATAIFDKRKKLVAILTKFPKLKFDYLFSTMNQKYKVSSKNIPFVGNKSANFKNGKTTIFLDAPHLSFEMTMNYVNNDFWQTYQNMQRKEVQDQKNVEQSKL